MKRLFAYCMSSSGVLPKSGHLAARDLAVSAAAARTLYVTVGNDRIAYRRIGRGPMIILANRLRGTLDTWDPLFLDWTGVAIHRRHCRLSRHRVLDWQNARCHGVGIEVHRRIRQCNQG